MDNIMPKEYEEKHLKKPEISSFAVRLLGEGQFCQNLTHAMNLS